MAPNETHQATWNAGNDTDETRSPTKPSPVSLQALHHHLGF